MVRARAPARRLPAGRLRAGSAGLARGAGRLLPRAHLHGGDSSTVLGRSRPGSLLALSTAVRRPVTRSLMTSREDGGSGSMTRSIHSVLGALFLALAACSAQSAAHRHGSDGAAPPVVLDGLGRHHQTVTTTSPESQAYFDQGLRLVYAFNHIEAESAFREAARLDPTCAMCYWGIALTHGSNYNSPTDARGRRRPTRQYRKPRAWPTGSPRASARTSRRARSGTRPPPTPTGPRSIEPTPTRCARWRSGS